MLDAEKRKVYVDGNDGFIVVPFSAESTDEQAAYDSAKAKRVRGLVSFDGTTSRTAEDKYADNVKWVTFRSAYSIEGTSSFFGLSVPDYQALWGDLKDGGVVSAKKGIVYGDSNPPDRAVVFLQDAHSVDETGVVTDYKIAHIFYCASMDLPNVSSVTRSEGDTTTRAFEVPFRATPVRYKDSTAGGKIKTVTKYEINSEDDADEYNALVNEGTIPFPTEEEGA